MPIKIVLRKDGVYDIYEETSDKWLFSTTSANNVLVWLSEMPCIQIKYVNNMVPELPRGEYCGATQLACCHCNPGPCDHRVYR